MSLRNRSWREIIKAMSHFGFYPVRQSGSHCSHAYQKRNPQQDDSRILIGILHLIGLLSLYV
ncbi:MAG: type II toxin-antitoxin system HicA family toxin [Thaumarchaeota archaeon]|nr:type II toxin-antitoxin system HicA family toxin [Nitrososphaerota archaeon]